MRQFYHFYRSLRELNVIVAEHKSPRTQSCRVSTEFGVSQDRKISQLEEGSQLKTDKLAEQNTKTHNDQVEYEDDFPEGHEVGEGLIIAVRIVDGFETISGVYSPTGPVAADSKASIIAGKESSCWLVQLQI